MTIWMQMRKDDQERSSVLEEMEGSEHWVQILKDVEVLIQEVSLDLDR